MQSSYPLKSQYHSYTKGKYLRGLFRSILRIANTGINDFLLELCQRDTPDSIDYGLAKDLYQELDKRRPKMEDATVKKIW
jgi:hypothetical protein